MLILVINCGSSSVKYNLFDVESEKSPCKGVIERIGQKGASLDHKKNGASLQKEQLSCRNHYEAIEIIANILIHPEKGVLSSLLDVAGIGHRVVHGGEEFKAATLVKEDVINHIEKFSELAPLHNPPSLAGIKGCLKIFPDVKQVAIFDTAFHQTMPEYAYCYGIPYEFYKKYAIRRYGFHGTSHRYISIKAAELLKKPIAEVNLITVHLGNGCSISAIEGGKSVDTSMGFTPLEGLLMGTRAGDIDPAVVFFLMKKENFTVEQIDDVLNKKSGLLGVSGVSNDMRDLLDAIKEGNHRARLAYDIFVYRIKKYIGAYSAVLGRVNAVAFSAGIGENVPEIKEEIEKHLKEMLPNTKFLTVKTNEELLIAKDTYALINTIPACK
ncbi:Acetate kinase [Candidatus Omnitrophus magneticus]|uniref:Acetate kinase n=1 Tax=Candidatus Omnitrophus magneticus TaxID=1609969 RepID=A0A0F0CS89_9BACT|nr:Acetate kinase [Candidatus Omnitrophus magneticus]